MEIVKIDLGDSLRELVQLFRRRKTASAYLLDIGRINATLDEVVRLEANVDCFFLLMAHNNGKPQRSGPRYKYRSVIGGSYRWEWMPNFHFTNYQYQLVDHDYEALLQNIRTYRQYDLAAAKINSPKLRAAYDFEKVKFTRFFFLRETNREMFYCVAGTTLGTERFESDRHVHALTTAVDKIRSILRHY